MKIMRNGFEGSTERKRREDEEFRLSLPKGVKIITPEERNREHQAKKESLRELRRMMAEEPYQRRLF